MKNMKRRKFGYKKLRRMENRKYGEGRQNIGGLAERIKTRFVRVKQSYEELNATMRRCLLIGG